MSKCEVGLLSKPALKGVTWCLVKPFLAIATGLHLTITTPGIVLWCQLLPSQMFLRPLNASIPGCIKYIFEDCYGCLTIFPSCFLSQTSTFFGQPYSCTTCVLLAVSVGYANLYVAVPSSVQLCLCQPVMLLPKTSQLLYPHS